MESKKGLKTPARLCITGSLLIRILFADATLYSQVVLYVRKMPPYELLLNEFLSDPPWP